MTIMKLESTLDLPLDRIREICERYHARELSVFGSALGAEMREDSDLDLLVEFEPDALIGFLTLARMQRELSNVSNRRVDLVPKRGLKTFIRESVLASARLIYEA